MRKRNVHIQFWLDKKEAETLKKKAKRSGISSAAYVRHLINDMVPQEAPPPDYYAMMQQLYIDVLKLHLGSKGNLEAIQKIPQLNLWLEFGASKMTQISLMAMGFTRTAALEFAELMVDENYDKNKCLWWFSQNDIHSMDLPTGILTEAEKILSLQ